MIPAEWRVDRWLKFRYFSSSIHQSIDDSRLLFKIEALLKG